MQGNVKGMSLVQMGERAFFLKDWLSPIPGLTKHGFLNSECSVDFRHHSTRDLWKMWCKCIVSFKYPSSSFFNIHFPFLFQSLKHLRFAQSPQLLEPQPGFSLPQEKSYYCLILQSASSNQLLYKSSECLIFHIQILACATSPIPSKDLPWVT